MTRGRDYQSCVVRNSTGVTIDISLEIAGRSYELRTESLNSVEGTTRDYGNSVCSDQSVRYLGHFYSVNLILEGAGRGNKFWPETLNGYGITARNNCVSVCP